MHKQREKTAKKRSNRINLIIILRKTLTEILIAGYSRVPYEYSRSN